MKLIYLLSISLLSLLTQQKYHVYAHIGKVEKTDFDTKDQAIDKYNSYSDDFAVIVTDECILVKEYGNEDVV